MHRLALRLIAPLLLTALPGLAITVPGHAAEGGDCRQVVEHKCGTCHFANYVCPRIESGRGSLAWRVIIKDMLDMGMKATDQEQDRLVKCLADPDPGVRALCTKKK